MAKRGVFMTMMPKVTVETSISLFNTPFMVANLKDASNNTQEAVS